MKVFAIVLFSISVVLLIIGLHQIMINGFAASYWIIMFATFFFFSYGYIKKYKLPDDEVLVETKDTIAPKKLKKAVKK